MDYFLNEENVVKRLVYEWKKHGKLVIAYDFDNTVFDYHNEGHTYEMLIELLRDCKEFGAHLIVYSAREDEQLSFVKDYLTEQNIPYDSVNEAAEFLPFRGKKLYYNLLLDDRAGLASAYHNLKEALQRMKHS
ncbi:MULTISPECIES: hypothetical protein [Pontibacillus]|uniref:Uncharacterized protein n=1 Tax=Pontibacillus chungwhensis TaxID=265426 RepID=A0ABY8UZH0_9BACI|nr:MULTISPECIES: hypothetical protein [Pontibacillus]MCD5324162.1 hypothetical protein [Pontibacillus sp. HN14]WIF97779.1 hypothetical protein QNI29_18955 [Pontibacillus chungwhensis]